MGWSSSDKLWNLIFDGYLLWESMIWYNPVITHDCHDYEQSPFFLFIKCESESYKANNYTNVYRNSSVISTPSLVSYMNKLIRELAGQTWYLYLYLSGLIPYSISDGTDKKEMPPIRLLMVVIKNYWYSWESGCSKFSNDEC